MRQDRRLALVASWRPAIWTTRTLWPLVLRIAFILLLTVALGPPDAVRAGDTTAPDIPDRSLRAARLAQGTMSKFRFMSAPVPLADIAIGTSDGGSRPLSSWRGKVLLLHFWASWCAPCREEIPRLARLTKRLGDARFEVFAVSLDKSDGDVGSFLASLGVTGLPLGRDPLSTSAEALGAARLPISILIDGAGREIGRLEGSADWLSDDALLLLMSVLSESSTPP
jgi:thiol-disulfide isomerase/thioredoxin